LKLVIACCSYARVVSFFHHTCPKDRYFFRKKILLLRDSAENKFPATTSIRSGLVKIFLLVTGKPHCPKNPSGFASCCINFRRRKLPVKVYSSTEPVTRTFAKVTLCDRITFSSSDESGKAFVVKNIGMTN